MKSRIAAVLALPLMMSPAAARRGPSTDPVEIVRLPSGAIQPSAAIDAAGQVHVLYFQGEPAHGDLFYARLDPAGRMTSPMRVNTQSGSAIGIGTIRGGHIALGEKGRVHVAWHGSDAVRPVGTDGGAVFYTRMNDAGTAFEAERNVVHQGVGLDAGTVAADSSGHVYVAWHAGVPGGSGEASRRLFVARSSNSGRTFESEVPASDASLGACGCCGVGALATGSHELYVLFRSAVANVRRDTYLLTSRDAGASYRATKLQDWDIAACPMSSYSLAENADTVVAAWETAGQVYWTKLSSSTPAVVSAPGDASNRKHPALAINAAGDVLLAWTEGTGWNKGGALAWQRYDRRGVPAGDIGRAAGVPVWSLAAAVANQSGGFTIIY